MNPETFLSSRLQDDITWRIRELSELVRACRDANGLRKEALLRASIPIIYAHWEGYFVCATNSYLRFLAEKRMNVDILRDEFWALMIRKKYKPGQILGETQFLQFLMELRSRPDTIFRQGNFERINGKSNLKSDVVKHSISCIGLNCAAFSAYYDFIDYELVERRNHVAHGASLRFEEDVVSECRDKVIELMRITQTEIENAVAMGQYRKIKSKEDERSLVERSER